MIRGGRVKDLQVCVTVNAYLDTQGVDDRRQRRSKYGAKQPK